MNRRDVEKVLKRKFHRDWRTVDYEVRGGVAARGFTVPVAGGDYYLDCTLAAVPDSPMTSDVISCYFLFSPDHSETTFFLGAVSLASESFASCSGG
jgi:hypothetical protein